MAQLTTTTGSGTQASTQSPQTAGLAASSGTQASSLQPGTATSLLNGRNGVPLHGQALTVVNINGATAATIAQSPSTRVTKHHINTALMGVSVLLLLIAIVLFWVTSRSVKSTT
jgi:hypothetical protein